MLFQKQHKDKYHTLFFSQHGRLISYCPQKGKVVVTFSTFHESRMLPTRRQRKFSADLGLHEDMNEYRCACLWNDNLLFVIYTKHSSYFLVFGARSSSLHFLLHVREFGPVLVQTVNCAPNEKCFYSASLDFVEYRVIVDIFFVSKLTTYWRTIVSVLWVYLYESILCDCAWV